MSEEKALPSPEDDGLLEDEEEELPRMTLFEHLEELRKRLLWSVAALFVGFLVCVAFSRQIFHFLSLPILEYVDSLVFLKVTDPFLIYMKVALVAAIFVTSPFLLYQVWSYIAPGLYKRERRLALPFVFFGSTFFLAGGVFGYVVAFPFAVRFLIELGGEFDASITVTNYLSFLLTVLLGLGVMFELPILIFMLSTLGVVTPRFLIRNFRWAVLIIFVVSAIITPTPDVFNLCVVALPTVALYLLGVGASAIAIRGRKRREAQAAAGG